MRSRLAIFAVTDVLVVTSVRDGLNLLPIEYMLAREHTPGALVLSEFCSLARILAGSITCKCVPPRRWRRRPTQRWRRGQAQTSFSAPAAAMVCQCSLLPFDSRLSRRSRTACSPSSIRKTSAGLQRALQLPAEARITRAQQDLKVRAQPSRPSNTLCP